MILDTYPASATVIHNDAMTPNIRHLRVQFDDVELRNNFNWVTGQFAMLSVLGYGEGPFGIANSPLRSDYLDFSINKVGVLTTQIHNLAPGDKVFVRGPFGNGFRVEEMEDKKNIVIIAGGCGLPPLRSVIEYIHDRRDQFGKLIVTVGARTPQDLLFKQEYGQWENFADVWITVDHPDEAWSGHAGVITTLFDDANIPIDNTKALICGPPMMYKFAIQKLEAIGLPDEDIMLSLERQMKCAVGLCQHCTVGKKYVCKDGPVFSYAETKGLFDRGHDVIGEMRNVCSAI